MEMTEGNAQKETKMAEELKSWQELAGDVPERSGGGNIAPKEQPKEKEAEADKEKEPERPVSPRDPTREELSRRARATEGAARALDSANLEEAKQRTSDLKVVGNGDLWQVLCKASSEEQDWMKSTKAMEVPGGCLVQVTTQQGSGYGHWACAEAVCFVPGVKIGGDINGGRKLVHA